MDFSKLKKLNKSFASGLKSGMFIISEIIRNEDQTDYVKQSMNKKESKFPEFKKAKYIIENSVKLNNGQPELMIFLSKKGKVLFYAYTNDLPGLSFFTKSIENSNINLASKVYL